MNLQQIKAAVDARAGRRAGKGFSLAELREASMDINRARRLNIPVDARRKTCLAENIKLLKEKELLKSLNKNEK